jgi:hypothetical protein
MRINKQKVLQNGNRAGLIFKMTQFVIKAYDLIKNFSKMIEVILIMLLKYNLYVSNDKK